MINEDYVSFETARLLKEKGFDVETEHKMWYVIEQFSTGCPWNSCTYKVGDVTREYNDDCCISMPTLQMAIKWLREVHKLIPIVLTGGDSQNSFYYWFRIDTIIEGKLKDAIYREDEKEYSSYEEAAEAAIKYCLEKIIKLKL